MNGDWLDQEKKTLRTRLPDLLTTAPGRFVLVKGEEVRGLFDTEEEALDSGYREFGAEGVFLVQEVSEENRVAILTPFFLEP